MTRRVDGIANTREVGREIVGLILEDMKSAKFSVDINIKVRPANSAFLNPHDDRVAYVDYTIHSTEAGHVLDGHAIYSTDGRRLTG